MLGLLTGGHVAGRGADKQLRAAVWYSLCERLACRAMKTYLAGARGAAVLSDVVCMHRWERSLGIPAMGSGLQATLWRCSIFLHVQTAGVRHLDSTIKAPERAGAAPAPHILLRGAGEHACTSPPFQLYGAPSQPQLHCLVPCCLAAYIRKNTAVS